MVDSKNVSSADNQQERLVWVAHCVASCWYVVGIADGEGSFNISVKRDSSDSLGWKVSASFNVSQRDRTLLHNLQTFFNAGTIRFRKDGVGYFEVSALHDLQAVIIPFFKTYRLQTKKAEDFDRFCDLVEYISAKKHRSRPGLLHLLDLRDPMNGGAKQRRNDSRIRESLIQESSETIC